MLSGEYRHSLDAKNRVSIPADMREELGENFVVVRNIRGQSLRIYSAEKWKEYVEPLKKLPREVSEQIYWFWYHDAMTTTPDTLGRVRIKGELLQYAGIDPEATDVQRNVYIVGCGDYGEIWADGLYEKHTQSMDMDEIRRILKESGL